MNNVIGMAKEAVKIGRADVVGVAIVVAAVYGTGCVVKKAACFTKEVVDKTKEKLAEKAAEEENLKKEDVQVEEEE